MDLRFISALMITATCLGICLSADNTTSGNDTLTTPGNDTSSNGTTSTLTTFAQWIASTTTRRTIIEYKKTEKTTTERVIGDRGSPLGEAHFNVFRIASICFFAIFVVGFVLYVAKSVRNNMRQGKQIVPR
ncbi:hypothetical protein LSAT2_014818 [Lamellibrachia satsuma]|nr:hypothetical protein LSAT2_013679 [Lamellibrachia satsuma]KAI0243331.1 hypothetical protein LSAT2_014818 [Lamellibrachia satsuma]